MKRVLVVDDQQLVLLSLQKCLSDLGYAVFTSNNVNDALIKFDELQPDLVMVDINMPMSDDQVVTDNHANDIQGYNGLCVVDYIKKQKKSETPVLILSGNLNQDVIEKGFALGAIDYMKKPLSLNEIGIRVKLIIGNSNVTYVADKNKFIKDKVIGIVIPCFNVEKTLQTEVFKNIVTTNLSYHLCFVNDASNDATLDILYRLKKENEGRISVFNCEKSNGNAEAIRLGMLHLAQQQQFDYIGFMDADLSISFNDFENLVVKIKNSDFKIVSASRINRIGAEIDGALSSKIVRTTIKYSLKKSLGMNFNDTKYTAKIMTKDLAEIVFKDRFITNRFFEIEIFMRIKKHFGKEQSLQLICEKPVDKWIRNNSRKLSFKDLPNIVSQIGLISSAYR